MSSSSSDHKKHEEKQQHSAANPTASSTASVPDAEEKSIQTRRFSFTGEDFVRLRPCLLNRSLCFHSYSGRYLVGNEKKSSVEVGVGVDETYFVVIDYLRQQVLDAHQLKDDEKMLLRVIRISNDLFGIVFGTYLDGYGLYAHEVYIFNPENPTKPQYTVQFSEPSSLVHNLQQVVAFPKKSCFAVMEVNACRIVNTENKKDKVIFTFPTRLFSDGQERARMAVTRAGDLTIFFSKHHAFNSTITYIQHTYSVDFENMTWRLKSVHKSRTVAPGYSYLDVHEEFYGHSPVSDIYFLTERAIFSTRSRDQIEILVHPPTESGKKRTFLGWFPDGSVLSRIDESHYEKVNIVGNVLTTEILTGFSESPSLTDALDTVHGNIISTKITDQAASCVIYTLPSVLNYQDRRARIDPERISLQLFQSIGAILTFLPKELLSIIILYAVTTAPIETNQFYIPRRSDINSKREKYLYDLHASLTQIILEDEKKSNPSGFFSSSMKKAALENFVELLKDPKKSWEACEQEVLQSSAGQHFRVLIEAMPQDAKAETTVVSTKNKPTARR